MIGHTLDAIERLVAIVAEVPGTSVQALAIIRARGMTPDAEALADAVTALQLRDEFLARHGDPYDFLHVQGPVLGQADAWTAAVECCEMDLHAALLVLAHRNVGAVRAG